MSIARKRLKPEISRSVALAAARRILLADGPQAVTLKAVAAEIGRTHANLIHHFGSAAGLQTELARSIADRVTEQIAVTVERERSGQADVREIVDQTFDAFANEGAGALPAWMILSGNRDALDPILSSIRSLVDQLSFGHEERHVPESTLALVLAALGDSLLGEAITDALGLKRDSARDIATSRLRAHLEALSKTAKARP